MKEFDDWIPPLIPEDEYELKFEGYTTGFLFGRTPKLILDFKIISSNEHFGTKITSYYNVQRIIGKPGKNGNFKVGWSSRFAREFMSLFNTRVTRLDRFPMSRFERSILIGKTKTVKKSANQKNLPSVAQYSVVNELVKLKEI